MGNPRWSVVWKQTKAGPHFEFIHTATRPQMQQFTWGSGNVQAVVVDGRPKRLQPPTEAMPSAQSPPSQLDDCGPFPLIDYFKTARTSLGWKAGRFSILVVTQSLHEDENMCGRLRAHGLHQRSGWDLADLQQFWLSWGAQGACNLDGGLMTQACYQAQSDAWLFGNNQAVPQRLEDGESALTCTAPLLFPYVVERPGADPRPGRPAPSR